ncbi:hypothetical protein Fmac_014673 [Flemingia macrophylla]|uniref:Uncharacterized protein n=1 Tax=Flemingia macrophylla TaxID=520843 RepID=A0ABD1MCE8_9FABA
MVLGARTSRPPTWTLDPGAWRQNLCNSNAKYQNQRSAPKIIANLTFAYLFFNIVKVLLPQLVNLQHDPPLFILVLLVPQPCFLPQRSDKGFVYLMKCSQGGGEGSLTPAGSTSTLLCETKSS